MQYKLFIINAFEQEPGKWRACVRRANGKPLITSAHAKLQQFVTGVDATSADAAMIMAMDAVDSGSFSRPTARSTEKFWRRGGDARES